MHVYDVFIHMHWQATIGYRLLVSVPSCSTHPKVTNNIKQHAVRKIWPKRWHTVQAHVETCRNALLLIFPSSRGRLWLCHWWAAFRFVGASSRGSWHSFTMFHHVSPSICICWRLLPPEMNTKNPPQWRIISPFSTAHRPRTEAPGSIETVWCICSSVNFRVDPRFGIDGSGNGLMEDW